MGPPSHWIVWKTKYYLAAEESEIMEYAVKHIPYDGAENNHSAWDNSDPEKKIIHFKR